MELQEWHTHVLLPLVTCGFWSSLWALHLLWIFYLVHAKLLDQQQHLWIPAKPHSSHHIYDTISFHVVRSFFKRYAIRRNCYHNDSELTEAMQSKKEVDHDSANHALVGAQIWGRQKGVAPICSDLLHFLPICSDLFSQQIRETPFFRPLL